jgi:hypothetical protein
MAIASWKLASRNCFSFGMMCVFVGGGEWKCQHVCVCGHDMTYIGLEPAHSFSIAPVRPPSPIAHLVPDKDPQHLSHATRSMVPSQRPQPPVVIDQDALPLPHGGGLALGAGAALGGEPLGDAEPEEAAPPPVVLGVRGGGWGLWGGFGGVGWVVWKGGLSLPIDRIDQPHTAPFFSLPPSVSYRRLICEATLRGGMWSPMKSPTCAEPLVALLFALVVIHSSLCSLLCFWF